MCSGRESTVQVVEALVLLEGIVPFTRDFSAPSDFADRPFWGTGHS